MTENSVANPHPSPQATNTPAVELSWDNVIDGTFPPTRQQRMQQAALQAAEQLQEQADLPVTHDRLTKALDLVLSNAVALYQDNTASVRCGSRTVNVVFVPNSPRASCATSFTTPTTVNSPDPVWNR